MFTPDLEKETKALKLVGDYVTKSLNLKENETVDFNVYIVSKSCIMCDLKFVITTSLSNGNLYVVTYDSFNDNWSIDPYTNTNQENISWIPVTRLL